VADIVAQLARGVVSIVDFLIAIYNGFHLQHWVAEKVRFSCKPEMFSWDVRNVAKVCPSTRINFERLNIQKRKSAIDAMTLLTNVCICLKNLDGIA